MDFRSENNVKNRVYIDFDLIVIQYQLRPQSQFVIFFSLYLCLTISIIKNILTGIIKKWYLMLYIYLLRISEATFDLGTLIFIVFICRTFYTKLNHYFILHVPTYYYQWRIHMGCNRCLPPPPPSRFPAVCINCCKNRRPSSVCQFLDPSLIFL